jgi:hypothetical protein
MSGDGLKISVAQERRKQESWKEIGVDAINLYM